MSWPAWSAVALHDDGWAIRALPPGRRDLGCFELWDRSLERSRRRRARAERNTGVPIRAVSAALLTATVVAPERRARDRAGDRRDHDGLPPARRRGPAVATAQARSDPRRRRRSVRRPRPPCARSSRRNGLEVDGVIGPMTRAALGGGATSTAATVTAALQRRSASPPTASTGRSRARRCATTRRAAGCSSTASPAPRRSAPWASRPASRSARRRPVGRRRLGHRRRARADRRALRVGRERSRDVRLLRASPWGVRHRRHRPCRARRTGRSAWVRPSTARPPSSPATSSSSTPTGRAGRRTSASRPPRPR